MEVGEAWKFEKLVGGIIVAFPYDSVAGDASV